MQNKEISNTYYWIYKIGFYIILALPILNWSPWFYPADWGKTIIFRSILTILLFLFAFEFFYAKPEPALPKILKIPIILSLLLLFIVFLVASFFSVDPYFSFLGSPLRSGGFINFACYIAFSVFTFLIIKKEDWKKFWDFSIGIGVLVCLITFIQFFGLFGSIVTTVTQRPSGTLGNPIFLGMYLLLLFFIALSFLLSKRNLYLKIFYGTSLLIFAATILITGSRAAYLGIIVGVIVFLILYPKKTVVLKYSIIALLIIIIAGVVSVNTVSHFPAFIQNNRIFQQIAPRLSINAVLGEGRFPAWKIAVAAIKEKPILGWGPENYSIAYDKYYDPNITSVPWWDRAHNIFLEVASQAGLAGLIAYLGLFFVLFWQLHKVKKTAPFDKKIIITGIESLLVGYLVVNFFSFDSFATYLIFFLLVGWCIDITAPESNTWITRTKKQWPGLAIMIVFFVILVTFLWQYNWVPFKTNAQINRAQNLVSGKDCNQSFGIMNDVLSQNNFLYSYARIQYVEFTIDCNNYYPGNNLIYIKKGLEVVKEAVKIQPLYTRYWLALGTYENNLAAQEQNANVKNEHLKQAGYYLDKASTLSPKQQDIIVQQAKLKILSGDYLGAQDYSQKCILQNSDFAKCYFYLGLTKIYLHNIEEGEIDLKTATDKGLNIGDLKNISQLVDAYVVAKDYQKVISLYYDLIRLDRSNFQYHASLGLAYKLIGDYKSARKEAQTVLEMSPESKPSVEAFLKTLPQ